LQIEPNEHEHHHSSHHQHHGHPFDLVHDGDSLLNEREVSRLEQAAVAALDAGLIASIRARHDPGTWTGKRGVKVLTAAVSAGVIDAFLARNPSVKVGRHLLESTLAGLVVNRLVNGSRNT
jgi:hypothetical protein